MSMLRKVRQTLALVFFVCITLLFLDFTGTIHAWMGWMAKIQFMPALLSVNLLVIAVLLLLTFLLGRVYCSVICPLGIMQDIISRINGTRKKMKYRFTYSPAMTYVRNIVLVIFCASIFLGLGSVVALLSPYSSYGRIASNLLSPVWKFGNNILAYFAERADSYAFYETEIWIKTLPTFIIAVITFVIIAILAWRNGRTYCNTICPVGTILGYLSRFSLFRIEIDREKCKNCRLCSKQCKSSCIDIKHHKIDYSRCVTCMDCLDSCKHDAIHYVYRYGKSHSVQGPQSEPQNEPHNDLQNDLPKNSQTNINISGNSQKQDMEKKTEGKPVDTSRRNFLTSAVIATVGATVKAQEMKVDGGLATIIDKKVPVRNTPIFPPGALSKKNFLQKCTGCQLCVSVCPNQVLRPSTDLMRLMQPEVSYEKGYCRPECTKCSEVCPTGAINLLSMADKSSTQIGHAVFIMENCVAVTDGVTCGNCARHCPSGAIEMIYSKEGDNKSPQIPAINVERCIGCGACENLCPSRPFSAIYVEGHERHRMI